MQTPTAKTRHPRLQQRMVQAIGPDGEIGLEALLDALEADYVAADLSNDVGDHLARRTSAEGMGRAASAEVQRQARLAQARMDLVLERASEAVVSCDEAGIVIAYNQAAERLYGYPAEEIIGEHASQLVHGDWPAARAKIRQDLAERPDAARTPNLMELKGQRRDGTVFDVQIALSRVDVDGVVTFTGFHRDVSEAKAEQARLVEARHTAEAANRAKTEFLAAMSHEIRTPLNGVLGMAAALETTQLSELQRKMLGVINESGQSLMTLLTDILDLSKIEAGHMEFEQMPFDLAASLQAVAGLFEQTARSKNLAFRVSADGSARGVYLGDPTRLRQVLQNLISNAMKFTKAGSVTVSASAEAMAGGRRAVRFEVVDTGVGVSEEAQGRLFSKFMQADRSTSRKFGGTGLGLAICRELVSAMGGEIGVRSEEGRGACFWFTLPLMLAAEVEPEADDVVEDVQDRPLRILAAEDNATNQFVLRAILGQKGLEATFVENGRLAVEAVQAQDYDLVLMDLHMPEMDGLSATQAIRALGGLKADVPVVAVTAEAMPEQVRRCMAAGMDGHVAKPIRPDVLYAVIEDVLTRSVHVRLMA
jgi:PAS domain S-box-containing protein